MWLHNIKSTLLCTRNRKSRIECSIPKAAAAVAAFLLVPRSACEAVHGLESSLFVALSRLRGPQENGRAFLFNFESSYMCCCVWLVVELTRQNQEWFGSKLYPILQVAQKKKRNQKKSRFKRRTKPNYKAVVCIIELFSCFFSAKRMQFSQKNGT